MLLINYKFVYNYI